jgi:sialic acid synthase SpsE
MSLLDIFKNKTNRAAPYIIAEAGVNHEGDMDIAKRLIDEACEGGADAIKFQTYKAETIASKNSPAYWDTSKEPTTSQFELFKKYDKFWKTEFEELKRYCDDTGIEFLSTPFDVESANFLNDLMPVFKISSSDITNRPFIEHMAAFKKPIILSTGASDIGEIKHAVTWLSPYSIPLALLHCILNYPTANQHANLGMIRDLRHHFPEHIIGYSDHTVPGDMRVLEIAAILGAVIIEKHFTHDKTLPGNDHYHAMDKQDLRLFRDKYHFVTQVLGESRKHALDNEEPARLHARRSLVASRFIASGSLLSRDDLTWKRPAHGISPSEIGRVLGSKVLKDIEEDTLLQWDMLKES